MTGIVERKYKTKNVFFYCFCSQYNIGVMRTVFVRQRIMLNKGEYVISNR